MKNRIFGLRTCPSAEDWQALLRGHLPTSRIEEYEAHLDDCPICVAQLDALTPSLPDDLWEAAREPVTATPEWAARCQGWSEIASAHELAEEGPLVFERKGKYKSHGPIAFGGMGEVYRAWEIGLERWVAIKVPSRTRRSPQAIARFLEEAPRQAQLEHANIVRVYARDEQDGVPFFAMELVTGETLARVAREGEMKPKRVAELMRQVAQAVHCAHKAGVFHRDLKPTNIMLTEEGVPRLSTSASPGRSTDRRLTVRQRERGQTSTWPPSSGKMTLRARSRELTPTRGPTSTAWAPSSTSF